MTTYRVLDVSELPEGTADSRALLWWGNLGMMLIEGTMFAMVLASYFYLRSVNLDWPPLTVRPPDLVLPTVALAILILSMIPMFIADRAALRDGVGTVKVCFAFVVLAGIAFLALRAVNMSNIGYKWSEHAYGSMIWTAVGLHTFHMLAATGETALLLVYSLVRPITKKQLLDFRAMACYWYFVVLWWVPFYGIVYLAPYFDRKG
jgi:heme/copper-type cytochrome/quinol oxidase subunit 3